MFIVLLCPLPVRPLAIRAKISLHTNKNIFTTPPFDISFSMVTNNSCVPTYKYSFVHCMCLYSTAAAFVGGCFSNYCKPSN